MIDNFGQIRQFALVYFVYYESFNAVQNVTYYYYRLWKSNAVFSKKKKSNAVSYIDCVEVILSKKKILLRLSTI